MKRGWIGFLLIAALCVNAAALSLPRAVEDVVSDELYAAAESGEMMVGRGFSALWEGIRGELGDLLKSGARSAALLMLLVLLCGVLNGLSDSFGLAAKAYVPYFAVLAAALLCAGDLNRLIGLGTATVDELSVLSKALLPTIAMAMAAGGCAQTASVWQAGTLMACDLLLTLERQILVPLLYCYIGTAAAGAVLPESHLDALASAMKKVLSWTLCAIAVLFTVYLTLSNVLAGTADKMSVKAGKFVISNAIPVVGGILSEATEAMLSGALALRGTLGVLGVFAVLSVCLVPLLRLAAEFLCYRLAALFSAMSGILSLQKFMEQLSGAFSLLLAMTACAASFLLVALFVSVTMVSTV